MQNLAQNPINTVCPVCGMPVDEALPPVIALVADDEQGDRIERIGACGEAHRAILARCPGQYAAAAASNELMSRSYDDA
jgi:hypothetical protein